LNAEFASLRVKIASLLTEISHCRFWLDFLFKGEFFREFRVLNAIPVTFLLSMVFSGIAECEVRGIRDVCVC
jgi:hypothetical protein